MKKINMHVSEELIEKLKAHKNITGIPMSETIRRAIEDFLKKSRVK